MKLLSQTLFLILSVSFFVFLNIQCSHGPCNNIPQRPEPSPVPSPSPNYSQSLPSPTPLPEAQAPRTPSVLVFKVTGEKQCQTGGGSNLDDVKAQLTSKNIPVFEAHTQADGLMHMALCGTPTGGIHVFAIPKKLQAKAQRLGFRIFKTRQ